MAQFKVKGILSFPHLFQPRAVKQGDEPKYSCSVLILKTDPQLAQVQQIIEAEKANGFPSGFPPKGKVCLKDGAVEYPQDSRMHNYMIISGTAKADQKPVVVDAGMQPVMDPATVYPGAEAWVQLNTFVYNMDTSKGVGAGLNGVMLTGLEGALGRLDNRPTAEQMFADVAGGGTPAPVAPPAAPAAPTPPPAAPQAPAQAAAAPAAPTPPTPPAPPAAPAAPAQLIMTAAANGVTYEQYKAQGWSDEQMIAAGVAQQPTFA